jgi:hypothetical protein
MYLNKITEVQIMIYFDTTPTEIKSIVSQVRPNLFSDEGLDVMIDHLYGPTDNKEELIELNLHHFTSSFTEYKTVDEALVKYRCKSLESLQAEESVVMLPSGGVIINTEL